jgi:phosphoribosylformylglycinamidine cyclo-ligase
MITPKGTTHFNHGRKGRFQNKARHPKLIVIIIWAKELAEDFPESYDHLVPSELVYSGTKSLTDSIDEVPIDAGKLVLSPTRTYAPIIKAILDKYRDKIHGMVHCSGGAQTKVLHFVDNVHVIKDNLFDVPPLFKTIQEESNTDWKEMYKVFNMGHRMELYVPQELAQSIIEISESFNVPAQIVGRVEACDGKKLTIKSAFGEFIYE